MTFLVGKNCQIHPSAVIDVEEGCLGDGGIVRENARLEGRKIVIGREAFVDRNAWIGGGSCFDPSAELIAGDWFHMGVNSHINIARGVYIGHEFGCGIDTKIFTHGAYLDSFNLGAPTQWAQVSIGDNVWCPNAWINPGVSIGSNVIVAARSLVTSDLPSNSLVAGSPARVLVENYFPRKIDKQLWADAIIKATEARCFKLGMLPQDGRIRFIGQKNSILVELGSRTSAFSIDAKRIVGDEGEVSAVLKDQLRRNGVRFRYEFDGRNWVGWEPRHFGS